MMNCRKIRELQSEAHGGTLTRMQRFGLWLHMKLCPPCERADRGLRRTLSLLRDLGSRESAPRKRRAA
jgi:hypothetical protein